MFLISQMVQNNRVRGDLFLKPVKELEDIRDELQNIVEASQENLEEELGEFEHHSKAISMAGTPEGTLRQSQIIRYYNTDLRHINTLIETLRNMETNSITEKKKEIEPKHKEHTREDKEALMYTYGSALESLVNAEKLLNWEEYETKVIGIQPSRRFPDEDALKDVKSEMDDKFHDLREEYVHALLMSSRYLSSITNVRRGGFNKFTEEDLEKAEEISERLTKVRKDLRKRAEDLDFLLLNHTAQLKRAEKYK